MNRFPLGVCVAIVMLTGCGGSPPPISVPGAMPQTMMDRLAAPEATQHHYKSLYSFKAYSDGAQPNGGLVALKGALYGTTYGGGGYHGPGTVFRITKAGKERILYSFTYSNDGGDHPTSGLSALNGTLYGVAAGGVPHSDGVVFTVFPGGAAVFYDFKGKPDGDNPDGSLTATNGSLYGVTGIGGRGRCFFGAYRSGCGTVFEVTTSGEEHVVYSFKGGRDGQLPIGKLVVLNGTLYGTTSYGGSGNGCNRCGYGTVFSISISGKESVLHRFKGLPYDAGSPNSVVALNNVLYGTGAGGTAGLGAIFFVTLSGGETILHNFTGGTDGANPSAGLEAVNGLLYGTTQGGGGRGTCYSEPGCGTVFGISTSGTEQVLYRFGGSPDGNNPNGYLTLVGGRLYGTTEPGGSANGGTVFRISP